MVPERSAVVDSQVDYIGEKTPNIKPEHEASINLQQTNQNPRSPGAISWRSSQHCGTHIGYTTELEPILFDISQATGIPSDETKYLKPDSRNGFLLTEPKDPHGRECASDAFHTIEELVRPFGPALLQSFRRATNQNFPIVEDAVFKAAATRQMSSLDPTLLATIYLHAAANDADNLLASSVGFNLEQLEDAVFQLFAAAIAKPALSTVQAGLLLMQRPEVNSRTLNTQLVSAAYELGLHLDCSDWNLSETERGLRKRLAWALYMQDKWCSLIHGRPSLVSKDHWAVSVLVEADFSGAAEDDMANPVVEEAKQGWELFCHMVALTEILSTMLDTFYTLKAMREIDDAAQDGTRMILEKAKPVQIRLKEWFTQLPASLKMDNTISTKSSSTGKRW